MPRTEQTTPARQQTPAHQGLGLLVLVLNLPHEQLSQADERLELWLRLMLTTST